MFSTSFRLFFSSGFEKWKSLVFEMEYSKLSSSFVKCRSTGFFRYHFWINLVFINENRKKKIGKAVAFKNIFSSIGIHSGTALMDLVGVFSSIEDQHMNIVSEFYAGLETIHLSTSRSFVLFRNSWKRFTSTSFFHLKTIWKRTQKLFKSSRKSSFSYTSSAWKASIKVRDITRLIGISSVYVCDFYI